MEEHEEKTSRRGRRAGAGNTRSAILAAAKSRFASDGFAATTIRKVASDAAVDPAQVMQFFRSKDVLFAASLEISPQVLNRVSAAFDGPATDIGRRLTRAFLEAWEEEGDDAISLRAMLRASVASEAMTLQVRDFVQYRLVEVLGPKLADHPDGVCRIGLAASMLVGIIMGRNIVHIPAIADQPREEIIALVGPAIQALLI